MKIYLKYWGMIKNNFNENFIPLSNEFQFVEPKFEMENIKPFNDIKIFENSLKFDLSHNSDQIYFKKILIYLRK